MPLEAVYGIAGAVATLNQGRKAGTDPVKMPDLWKSPTEQVAVTDNDRERAEAMLAL